MRPRVESADSDVPSRAVESPPSSAKTPSPARLRELGLGLFLLLVYGFFYQAPLWNEHSRFNLVRAIVDERTLRIDTYHHNTGDKALFKGRYYSDKLPGSSLIALPTYALIRTATHLGVIEPPSDSVVLHALAFTASGLPSVATALLLLRFLRSYTAEGWALTVTAGYAVGTLAFPYATMFFGHAASTACLFAAFYLLWTSRYAESPIRPLMAGICAGFGVLTELPVALGVLILIGYCAWNRPRHVPFFIVGGLPSAFILLGYNWLAFEHPLRLGYQYAVSFADAHSRGLVGVNVPNIVSAFDLFLAPRGLLRLSPWLALAPLGILAFQVTRYRREVIVCSLICLIFLLYNSGYHLPFGGASAGPRFLIPALPFAAILVAFSPLMFRSLAEVGILVSVSLTLVATVTMPSALEIVRVPFVDEWLPRFVAGDLADTTAWRRLGLVGLQPLVVLGLAALASGVVLLTAGRPAPSSQWLTRGSLATLCALVLVFGTPLTTLSVSNWSATARADVRAPVIRDSGVTVAVEEGHRLVARPWVRLENGPKPLDDAILRFTIVTPTGEQVWRGDRPLPRMNTGERRRLELTLDRPPGLPGVYSLRVAIVSADGRRIMSETADRPFRFDRL